MSERVCFIGHRRIGFGDIRKKLKESVLKEIESGCKYFTMGTHGEFDQMALSVCRELREDFKDIEIFVVITSFNQIKKVVEHDEIFGDEVYTPFEDVKTIMYSIEEVHFKRKITESNRQMIDDCDTVVCYVNKNNSCSGAKSAMHYAKKKGKKLINLYNEKDEPTFGMTEQQKKDYYVKLFAKHKKRLSAS